MNSTRHLALSAMLSVGILPSSGALAGPLPDSAGAALKSGWQLVGHSVAYGPVGLVSGSLYDGSGSISTEVYRDMYEFFVLRKDNDYIECVAQDKKLAGKDWDRVANWCAEIE